MTAEVNGEVVVFLIGMRINRGWKVHRWLPIARAMPRMFRELEADPDSGFLGFHTWLGGACLGQTREARLSSAALRPAEMPV